MEPKRILLIIPYGGVGGMERLALTFYNYYKQKGHTVKALKLIKLETDIINFGEDELFLKDYDLHRMPITKRFLFYLSAPLSIRKIIKREKITHSICFGDMSNLFSSLSFTKEFKVGSIHSFKSVEFQDKNTLNKIFKWSYRNTYRNLDKVVCISNTIKEDLIENCAFRFTDKLEVIYNPHDIEAIQKGAGSPFDSEEEQEIFSQNTILFLGRLSYAKSPWHLLKAFHILAQRQADVKLVFIGDGEPPIIEYVKKLIDTFNIADRVVLLGRKSNPYRYLAKAKVLALSSHFEGTPNVIVEAIALDVPVVTSLCTKGVFELMSMNGEVNEEGNIEVESGIITPALFKGKLGIPEKDDLLKEEHDLADALEQVLATDTYKKTLVTAKEALLEKFDLDKVTTSYLTPIN